VGGFEAEGDVLSEFRVGAWAGPANADIAPTGACAATFTFAEACLAVQLTSICDMLVVARAGMTGEVWAWSLVDMEIESLGKEEPCACTSADTRLDFAELLVAPCKTTNNLYSSIIPDASAAKSSTTEAVCFRGKKSYAPDSHGQASTRNLLPAR
jgi:hypothetical protein